MRPLSAQEKPPSRLERFASSRWAAPLVIAAAVALACSSLRLGFAQDDYVFRLALRDGTARPFDLYDFGGDTPAENVAKVATGAIPWWTSPSFELHLVRPLTSLAFAADYALFGSHAVGYHVTSLLWFAAMLVVAWLLLRRLMPGAAGLFALLVFSLRAANALPYAWLCARHVLVAAVPALVALHVHVRARRDGWQPGRWLAPLLFVLALGGSEAALAIAPFWIALAVVEGRESRDWRRAVAGAAPVVSLALVYVVLYRALGAGARSNPTYGDPLLAPAALLRLATTRVPLLLADALLGAPVAEIREASPVVVLALGAGATVLCAAGFARVRELSPAVRRSAAWLAGGALAAIPIGLLGPAWGHVLLIPGIGFSALAGALVHEGLLALLALLAPGRVALRPFAVATAAILVFMHVVVAPIAALRAVRWLEHRARFSEAVAHTAELGDASPKRVLVMSGSEPDVFFFPKEVLADESPGRVACWSTLSASGGEHRVTRTGARSFSLEVVGPSESEAYSWVFYTPLSVGYEAKQCGATIRVEALDRDRRPSRLSVRLDEDLESPDLAMLTWNGERFVRFLPPTETEVAEVAPARRGSRIPAPSL